VNLPTLIPVNVTDPARFADPVRALKALSDEMARHAASIKQLAEGQNVVTGTVTLRASNTTTTVSKAEIPPGGQPFLSPRTANAAAEIGNGTMSIAEATKGQFVITHANNGQTDRTFGWVVFKAG
jgi:hypothetical protein